MRIWYKEGVFGELVPEAAEGLRRLKRYWFTNHLGDLFITSLREGTHLPHSYHANGRAFDIQLPPRDIKVEDFLNPLLECMGSGWVMVNEENHLHFQLSWKD